MRKNSNNRSRTSAHVVLGMAALVALSAVSANAATKYWDTDTAANLQPDAGTWDTNNTANWSATTGGSNPLVAWQAGDDASFSNKSGSANYQVTVTGTVDAASITSGGNLTLTGGTIQVSDGVTNTAGSSQPLVIDSALQLSSATQDFTSKFNSSNITVNGVVSETTGGGKGIHVVNLAGVSPSGSGGYLALTNANTFTGGVTIGTGTNTTNLSGVVEARNNAALGTGAVTLNGGMLSTRSASSAITLANNVVVNAGTNNVLYVDSAADLTLSGNISGSGTVNRTTGNALRFSGDNSGFSGTLSNKGSLYFNSATSGSGSAIWDLQAYSTASLEYTGAELHLGALTGIDSAKITTSNATGNSSYTLVIGEANAPSAAFSGGLQQFNATRLLNVVKRGIGIQSVGMASGNQQSTYGGTTLIETGEWRVDGTHSGAGDYTVDAGATLGGTGTIGLAIASKNINVNGTLAPGDGGIGTLTVNTGSINVAGAVGIDIGSLSSFDRLVGSYKMNYGGALNVLFSNDANIGDTFDLFDFASFTGDFSSLTASGLQAGKTISFDASTGVLTVTAVPEPATMITMLAAVGAMATMRRRRSARV